MFSIGIQCGSQLVVLVSMLHIGMILPLSVCVGMVMALMDGVWYGAIHTGRLANTAVSTLLCHLLQLRAHRAEWNIRGGGRGTLGEGRGTLGGGRGTLGGEGNIRGERGNIRGRERNVRGREGNIRGRGEH